MAERPHPELDAGRAGSAMAPAERDSANELYDHAFSLLAASLGCIEASLPELRDAVPELRDTALTTPADADPDHGANPWEPAQIRANFALLARDLSNTRTSCAAVRRLVGPALAKRWA